MTRSRYSRPSASQTRQPAERSIALGTPGTSPPNSASGRLLPVEVTPATELGHRELQRAERLGGLAITPEIDPPAAAAPDELARSAEPVRDASR